MRDTADIDDDNGVSLALVSEEEVLEKEVLEKEDAFENWQILARERKKINDNSE